MESHMWGKLPVARVTTWQPGLPKAPIYSSSRSSHKTAASSSHLSRWSWASSLTTKLRAPPVSRSGRNNWARPSKSKCFIWVRNEWKVGTENRSWPSSSTLLDLKISRHHRPPPGSSMKTWLTSTTTNPNWKAMEATEIVWYTIVAKTTTSTLLTHPTAWRTINRDLFSSRILMNQTRINY